MKYLLAVLVIAGTLITAPSCKEMNDNDGKTQVVQDSLINILPTWQALNIEVSNDRSQMDLVVGDASFYKASDEVKKQKALDLGRMILRIYGPNNYLEKGTLTVTRDVHNKSNAPADGIKVPIDIAALKKGQ